MFKFMYYNYGGTPLLVSSHFFIKLQKKNSVQINMNYARAVMCYITMSIV